MASSITSLGVASGNDFSTIVEELVSLKTTQVTRQTTQRANANTIELSGVSELKSALSTFQSAITAITDDTEAFNVHSITTTQSSSNKIFSVTAADDISNTNFDLAVTQVAKAEKDVKKFSTDDGFNNSFEAGTLTFDLGDDETFTVDVDDGDTLEEIRNKINDNSYGVTASLVKTSSGYTLSISGGTTGDDATPITITSSAENDSTPDGRDSLSSLAIDPDSDYTDQGWTHTDAQDAVIEVDGEEVRSSTNKFEGVVAGLDIEVYQVSETASDTDTNTTTITNGTDDTSDDTTVKTYNVDVSTDSSASAEKMQNFVDAYNTMISTLTSLSASNTYTDGESNEDGGDLAGDASVKSIMSSLQNMITRFSKSDGGMTIFDMGLTFNDDGTLSFSSSDFEEAMETNANAVNNLFADDEDGLLSKMDTYLDAYTETSGILDQRTARLNEEKSDIEYQQDEDQATIDAYEAMITEKYSNLDTLMANNSSSLSSLTSVLSSLSSSS
jgi:flagellar hook-associated protein 2